MSPEFDDLEDVSQSDEGDYLCDSRTGVDVRPGTILAPALPLSPSIPPCTGSLLIPGCEGLGIYLGMQLSGPRMNGKGLAVSPSMGTSSTRWKE